MRRAPFAVTWLLVAVALSGCFHGPDGSESTADYNYPSPPLPNFNGNWSRAEGNFTAYRIQVEITPHNATTNEPITGSCRTAVPFSFDLDVENRTLRVSQTRALHPLDPGPLRVALLLEFTTVDRCLLRGIYGINEDSRTPEVCQGGLSDAEKAQVAPWRCNIPVHPPNQAGALMWLNLTVALDASAPGGFRIVLNGHAYDGDDEPRFEMATATSASGHVRYEGNVHAEALGLWPYGSVRRS